MSLQKVNINSIKSLASQILPQGGHVWLYGSRARGTHTKDSDWDLLILLDKDKIENVDHDQYCFPFAMLGWESGEEIVPILYSKAQWEKQSFTPFYKNVEHDKILLV